MPPVARVAFLPAPRHAARAVRALALALALALLRLASLRLLVHLPAPHLCAAPAPHSFTVRWLDTADAGKQAELKIGDICLLDSRGLDQHPQYRQYMAAMEGGTRRAVAGKGPRQPPARRPPPASPAEAISDADSEGEEAAAAAQGAARPARGAQQQEQEQAQRQAPRKLVLRPPPCASGPPCALCKLPTLLAEDSADVEDEVRRELGGLYGGRYVVHRR